MATATTKRSVKITLELTEDEAMTLAFTTSYIGGAPSGPRGHMDSIRGALRNAGINYEDAQIRGDGSVTIN